MSAPQMSGTGLFLQGSRESGLDVRVANITAAMAVANVIKTSLGPVGLDKMLVDDIGDVTITNDGATILQLLEVEHPAARILVNMAQLQEQEVGDGTTSVVLLAAELLRRAQELILTHGAALHPTTILSGYRTALKAALAYLKQELVVNTNIAPSAASSNNSNINSNNPSSVLVQAAKTSLQSKWIGSMAPTEGDYFAQMAVKAVQSVKTSSNSSDPSSSTSSEKYPLSAIHILKAHGQSSLDSHWLEQGFCLAATRAAQGMPTQVGILPTTTPPATTTTTTTTTPTTATSNSTTATSTSSSTTSSTTTTTTTTTTAVDGSNMDGRGLVKIALLDMNLQRHRMGLGIELKVQDPREVEKIHQRELDITKEKIGKILDSGAQVVLTTKGIDDTCLKYFVERQVLAVRRVPMADLKRLAKATGGSVVVTLADLTGSESVLDASCLGQCQCVQEVRVGDGEMLQFHQVQGAGAATLVLRGANELLLDEMERALHDAMSVVKRMLEHPTLVAGGGAVETALSVYLEQYAAQQQQQNQNQQQNQPHNNHQAAREAWAIAEFAQALLVIPKTLAVNAALDSSELVAQLRACHAKALAKNSNNNNTKAANATTTDNDNNNDYKFYGLDLTASGAGGSIRNNILAGVVEPALSKIKALRLATEAAITILRIDDRIVVTSDE